MPPSKSKPILHQSQSSSSLPTLCIHIFRRDYRLHDNTALIKATATYDTVIPVFIFTDKQINPKCNPYRSDASVQFLCESLEDLDTQLQHIGSQLYIFYDDNDDTIILESLIHALKPHNLKAISFNADYTKYSKQRDATIAEMCKSSGLECLIEDDICLNPPGTVITTTGKVYSKFTPFWRASASKDIRKPSANPAKNYLLSQSTIAKAMKKHTGWIDLEEVMKPSGRILGKFNWHFIEQGGRENGLAILKRIVDWKDYDNQHDQLAYNTTHLSAFNKFGCVSIREVYHAMIAKLGKESGVVRQLFWRDFFYHLSKEHPEIYEGALNPKYRAIRWEKNIAGFKAWCEGRTGFPVVDACMRELNTTGYMHNRGRLIVSSFLCRMLHQDWRDGERYFASRLYDYDPAQNNFGWQVSGANSSGTTSRPLEQTILNPWIQSVQFDPKGEYIKKWCPELADVSAADLHKWHERHKLWLDKGVKYIAPMLDYKKEKEENLKMYRKYI
jgi:deoxyribodipyrimidine photo-lyase